MNDLIKYTDGEIELVISVEKDTIWLSQLKISELFETSTDNIGVHLKNIYKEKELDYNTTTEESSVVRQEGKRKVKRLLNLETDIQVVKSNIKNNTLEIKQGIFYDGQIFDAYIFVSNLLKNAKSEIILIDSYIDETVLILFSKYPTIRFTIVSKSISKQLKLDIEKYNTQYQNLEVKISNKYHDRFLIIDNTITYHIGASLKDLAKKVFAFSLINTKLFGEIKINAK